MDLDEGSYMILKAAPGAYSCSRLPLPKTWDSIHRPHVALVVPMNSKILRIMLSEPCDGDTCPLKVSNLDDISHGDIVEVKYSAVEYRYFRKDSGGWTKVGSSDDPFFVEVFTAGLSPLYLVSLDEFSDHADE